MSYRYRNRPRVRSACASKPSASTVPRSCSGTASTSKRRSFPQRTAMRPQALSKPLVQVSTRVGSARRPAQSPASSTSTTTASTAKLPSSPSPPSPSIPPISRLKKAHQSGCNTSPHSVASLCSAISTKEISSSSLLPAAAWASPLSRSLERKPLPASQSHAPPKRELISSNSAPTTSSSPTKRILSHASTKSPLARGAALSSIPSEARYSKRSRKPHPKTG